MILVDIFLIIFTFFFEFLRSANTSTNCSTDQPTYCASQNYIIQEKANSRTNSSTY